MVAALATSRASADQLFLEAEQLPTLPDIPNRALHLLEDPDASLSEVGDVIALDPVLTARCLRLVNSPTFAARGQVETIHAAVTRLGAQEVRSLLLTATMLEALRTESTRLNLSEIWRHAIASGVLARRLARDLREPEVDRAYLAGLLHSLGEVALATCFPARFDDALRDIAPSGAADALDGAFGMRPSLFCAHLLAQWNLPAPVVEAVAFHEHPSLAPEHPRLAEIVHTASAACRAFGLGAGTIVRPESERPTRRASAVKPEETEPEDRDWQAEISRELLTEACGGDPERYLESLEAITDSLGEILAALLS